ncbi:UbiA prenyltransferase [Pholiota conissans]|uniref:4-hydroxybenzoate polyprenyltransferase, mitochondrial n=1 Tax=Pholiota conissans TaxID=109636 RepID=A0A9P6CYN3_9AGAR|nr:UbiA prenyltransferase [Pholiota conissans]
MSNKQSTDLQDPLHLVSPSLRPYIELIRLEKPTGTILMFWPFAWGLTMAAFRIKLPLGIYAVQLMKCFVGAIIVRSSACTVNDIIDREMDAGVGRTQRRPLPSGQISVSSALIFLLFQYVLGISFFYLAFSNTAPFIDLIRFVIYPLLKRCTHWPQAWLGIAMNFGFITAWSASVESFDVSLLVSSLMGCWCWTMLYDTIYACQDIKDDVKVGVRSTAILFGTWIRPLLVGCGLLFLVMLSVAGLANTQGPAYFVISVGGTATHLIWQYMAVDLESPKSCWTNFKRNGHLGWIVWAGLLVDYFQLVSSIHVY